MRDNHMKLKREFVLEQLMNLGVTHSQTGKNIYALSYEELKFELLLATFRQIDVEKSESKWF